MLAHLPSIIGGMAVKGDDYFAVFACSACHTAMDEHRMLNAITRYQLDALEQTLRHWFVNGDLSIAGDKGEKPKAKTTKALPPRSLYRRGE